MLVLALLFAAQVATSSTADGVAVAHSLLDRLQKDSLTTADLERDFLRLDERGRQDCLDAWAIITKLIGKQLEVYRHMRSIRDQPQRGSTPKIKDEGASSVNFVDRTRPSTMRRSPKEVAYDPIDRRLDGFSTDDLYAFEEGRRTESVAIILSLLLGFGAGNFYAGSNGMGAACFIGQGVAVGLAVAGATKDVTVDPRTLAVDDHGAKAMLFGALALAIASRLLDVVTAPGAVREHNKHLMQSIRNQHADSQEIDLTHSHVCRSASGEAYWEQDTKPCER